MRIYKQNPSPGLLSGSSLSTELLTFASPSWPQHPEKNNTSIDIYKYVKRIVCYTVASYIIWRFIKRMNSKVTILMLVVMHRAGLGRCFMTEGLQESVRSSIAWAGRFSFLWWRKAPGHMQDYS